MIFHNVTVTCSVRVCARARVFIRSHAVYAISQLKKQIVFIYIQYRIVQIQIVTDKVTYCRYFVVTIALCLIGSRVQFFFLNIGLQNYFQTKILF